MNLRTCWAKTDPFQSVYTHGIVSGSVAQILLKEYLSEGDTELLERGLLLDAESVNRFVGYLVSLHDIGKLEYSFQAKDDAVRENMDEAERSTEIFVPHVRHEKTSQKCLKKIWDAEGEDKQSGIILSRLIGAHHQGKNGDGHFRESSSWYVLQKSFEAFMKDHFLDVTDKRLPIIDKNQQGAIAALLLGLLILSDWISSGELFADAETWIDSNGYQEAIRRKTEEFIEKSGLSHGEADWSKSFCGLWKNIPMTGRRPLQIEIETAFRCTDIKPALVLIEAPMGEGKTEAGLFAALQMAQRWKKDGFYVALPTAATSNQMVARVRALLEMHSMTDKVRLLHSMAWLQDNEEDINSEDEHDEIRKWLAPVKRGLLGQYAVGTVDQAMFCATNVKYGVLRLLGLSNKVLVIDEIHSYDAYMSEIIVRLLEWCKALEVPVVLLSATLPPKLKEKLLAPYTKCPLSGDYPLITIAGSRSDIEERRVSDTTHKLTVAVQVDSSMGDEKRIAERAIDEVKEGGCLCVLMNTVHEAQRVYTAIKERYDGDLLLFHGQFPLERRTEIENECIRKYGKDKKNRPKKSILVATQVVEQSLDVDFDVMMTEAAPIDLVLQRIGRVFRHDDTPRPQKHQTPQVIILAPEDLDGYGASAYVYPECLLKSSVRLLKQREYIKIPEDISGLVKNGYDPDILPEEEIKLWLDHQIKEQVEAGASQQFLISPPQKTFSPLLGAWPYEDDEEAYTLSAKTRLGEPSVKVALLSPVDLDRLRPFFKNKDNRVTAPIRNRKLAEDVLKKSVSVRVSRLGSNTQVPIDIKGDVLLSGVRIFPAENGIGRVSENKTIRFDNDLGLIIEG